MDRQFRIRMREAAQKAQGGTWRRGDGSFLISDLPHGPGGIPGADESRYYDGAYLIAESIGSRNIEYLIEVQPHRILALLLWAEREFERGRRYGVSMGMAAIDAEDTASDAKASLREQLSWKLDDYLSEEQQGYEDAIRQAYAADAQTRGAVLLGKAEELLKSMRLLLSAPLLLPAKTPRSLWPVAMEGGGVEFTDGEPVKEFHPLDDSDIAEYRAAALAAERENCFASIGPRGLIALLDELEKWRSSGPDALALSAIEEIAESGKKELAPIDLAKLEPVQELPEGMRDRMLAHITAHPQAYQQEPPPAAAKQVPATRYEPEED